MFIKQAWRGYREYSLLYRGYAKASMDRSNYVVKMLVAFIGVEELEQLTEDKVLEFFNHGRKDRNWGNITVITYKRVLDGFFGWCVRKELMDSNPASNMEMPRPVKKLPKTLTRQQAMRILEVVYNLPGQSLFERARNHAVFSTFLFAGLRKSELLRLRLTDVDLENYSLFVYQGKGSKDRILPVSTALADSLEHYLKERRQVRKSCPEIFTSTKCNVALPEIALRRVAGRVKEASGIYFTIHQLRHTFATLMLEGGCDIYSLSKMMGHSDIKTTTIYLSASAEHLRGQITKHPLNGF